MSNSVFVIAEIGVNHNGSPEIARNMIEVAKECGADAVKFQTFKAENLVTKDAPKAEYQLRNEPGSGSTQFDMLKNLEIADEEFVKLKQICDENKIEFMSTPFDEAAVDLIAPLVKRFKIASGDLVTFPLLKQVKSHGLPVILSTGMANIDEIGPALKLLHPLELTVLHCTSNYPCGLDEINMRAMQTIRDTYRVAVGYSDHTIGSLAALVAVSLGATVIEKHFTLDQSMSGPDHAASMEPRELKEYISQIREVERALGNGVKKPSEQELKTRDVARKSLIWKENFASGTRVSEEMFCWKRPGTGIYPDQMHQLIGKTLTKDVRKDNLVCSDQLG